MTELVALVAFSVQRATLSIVVDIMAILQLQSAVPVLGNVPAKWYD